VHCAALPETLLESELFGHERGAFTDAKRERKGLFELADKGTVFLDEIGDMSQALQVKLLRFLEERALRRVGGSHDIRVDAQVVAATNRDLERAISRGNFRNDLYYRLCVLPVRLPALRDRTGDVELLVRHFIGCFNSQFDKRVGGVSANALHRLQAYPWPGNVRELRNLIERAVLLADDEELHSRDFVPFPTTHRAAEHFELPPDGLDLRRLERDLVAQAVARTGGNLTRAGWLLGLSRDQVRYRLQKFGLAEPSTTDDAMVS
jgi:transcriptional regulator with PAS, ATPase and Fis domain